VPDRPKDSQPYTPDSEATLHLSEAGLQLVINAYQKARPEEFRIVSANYSDGDPAITPLSLNDDGEWLDYSLRIQGITIDMAPPNPGNNSPLPPATGQIEISAQIAIEFRNFADAQAVFDFPINLWIRFEPRLITSGSDTFVMFELKDSDLRVAGIGPDPLGNYMEYIMTLIVRSVFRNIRLPTTFNLQDVMDIVLLDLDVKQNTLQLYAAIQRQSSGKNA
jgi:hypothetical protein